MADNSKSQSTMRWKLDIAQFKKNIAEAKREITAANAEFKEATRGSKDWADSITGVEAKTKQLESNLASQNRILEQLNSEYATTVEQLGEASPEAQRLAVQIKNQQAAIYKTEDQLKSYNGRLAELQEEQRQSESALGRLTSEISQQESELAALKTAYANAVIEFGKGSTETNKLASEIQELSGKLEENKGKLKDAENAADELDSGFGKTKEAAKEAGDGFTVMKGVLADLVSNGIQWAAQQMADFFQDFDSAASNFQARTGTSTEAMQGFNDVMEDLYSQNYGESMQDLGEKMAYVKQVTGEVDPTKLGELTKNAIGLSDTFGSDFEETVRGVTNLMKHFGIDSETAFDLFAKGSQNGLDYTDELGDNIAEYGGNFAEAGYSAQEYFQLLQNGSQGGAYNLDKVNDSINEVKNRLGDGTIEKNLSMFSQGTQDTFHAWQNGQATMKDVIDSIVGDIDGCTNQQEALTMAATAFGTMGEDANLDVVKSLTSLGDSYDDVKGTMEGINDVNYNNVSSQLEELKRQFETEVAQPLLEVVVPALKNSLGWIMDHGAEITAAVAGIATGVGILVLQSVGVNGLISGFKSLKLVTLAAEGAQKLLNMAQAASPMGLIVTIIGALVAAIMTLWATNEDFRNFILGLWDNIKNVLGGTIEAIVNFFTVDIPNAIQNMLTFFQNLPGNIAQFLQDALNRVVEWVTQMGSNAMQAGRDFLQNVVSFIQQLPGKVAGFLANIISNLANWVGDMARKGAEGAKSLFDNVVNGLSSLPGKMLEIGTNIVKGIWEGISNAAGWLWNQMTGFGNSVVSNFKKAFGIASPSKVMRDQIGKYLAQGIGEGFGDELPNTIKGMRSNLGGMVSALDGELGGIAGVSGINGGRVQVVNFYQTNNSPTALDRLSIYRDTKSLMFNAKVGLQNV